jgi:hypothetical protein
MEEKFTPTTVILVAVRNFDTLGLDQFGIQEPLKSTEKLHFFLRVYLTYLLKKNVCSDCLIFCSDNIFMSVGQANGFLASFHF